MSVPDGYDLAKLRWPPAIFDPHFTTHPLYQKFLKAAESIGFDTESEGFVDSELGYFLFFIAGNQCQQKEP